LAFMLPRTCARTWWSRSMKIIHFSYPPLQLLLYTRAHETAVQQRRLWMWRWSFSGVHKLRDDFKPRFAFQQWNRG
jgi:hypothetical protein